MKQQKSEMFFDKTRNITKAKKIKQAHALKNYANTYNVEILNSFNPDYNSKILNLKLKTN